MKFTCNRAALQKSIAIVEKAVAQRSSVPLLDNMFLQVSNNQLKLRGNDMEIGIESSCPVEAVDSDGMILVKAKTFSNIISKLDGQFADISVNDQYKIDIKAEHVDFDLLGISVEEYPSFPEIEQGIQFDLSVEDLKQLIKYTIFSVSFDETKQFLNGILIKNEQDILYFVSTDGYRLSLKKKSLEPGTTPFSVIVPYKAMNELNKIIHSLAPESIVSMTVSESQVAFKSNEFVLISRIIKGQFPDYRQVLPKQIENTISLSRRLLHDSSDRASIIASASNYVVRFYLKGNQLILKANASSMGDFTETHTVDRIKGENDVRIAFNIRLMLDVIKNLESDDIILEFNNEISPCIVRSVSDDDYLYIIMPIRTSDYND